MSIYYCHHCDNLKDGNYDECEDYKGELVCLDCYVELTESDTAFQWD